MKALLISVWEKWNEKVWEYIYNCENSTPFLQFLEFLRVCLYFHVFLFICETRDCHSGCIIILEIRHREESKRCTFLEGPRHLQVAL